VHDAARSRALIWGRAAACGAAALLVASLLWATPPPARAADPNDWAAAQFLAGISGGDATDFSVVYQRGMLLPGTDEPLWAGKLVDARTGELSLVYRDGGGTVGGAELLQERETAAAAGMTPLERKSTASLLKAVNAPSAGQTVPVAVWLDVDVAGAEGAVVARHPEVTWLAGRPLIDNLAALRQIRRELYEARAAAFDTAQDGLAAAVAGLGGTIGYASTSAPLAFVDMPTDAVPALAELSQVVSMGLEGTTRPTMTSAGPTVAADWTTGSGDQGTGVRVAVVEYHNVRGTGDLAGQVVRSYSTTGRLAYTGSGLDHPTWVAGAVASRDAVWRGVAPGADIVSASTGGYVPSLATDRAIIAAADWAINPSGGDADIVNTSLGQDTATGAEEARRYFDSISAEDGRLVVAAAGNYTTFGHWDVLSPGTGYNVLTVGGVDDRGTRSTADDRVWFVPGSNGSNYRDPSSTAWNAHGDFNKPNVSAPAVNVITANGRGASGTSIASPITAGVAAQLIARAPTLATWPEAVRAIIAAGAIRRTPMPDGSLNADHEGAGTVSALWSNRILVAGGGSYGGYQLGVMTNAQPQTHTFSVLAGQRVRVALSWSSHTAGGNLAKSDALLSDLDLRVTVPGGAVVGSYTFDNANEWLDFTASQAGTVSVRVVSDRFEAASEPYAVAWAISGPFFDIDGSPFADDILWAWNAGITAGCAPSRYCPLSNVSREQMASFLVRALDLTPGGPDRFTDDESSQHEADINALAQAGLTDGCAATRYCPTLVVDRAQMASFLVRALNLPASGTDAFSDDEGSQHEAAINALAAAGITTGCGSGRYCPNAPVTRGEMAAFLHRGFGD
jgi:subtilase family protein/S-layer family protein